MRYLTALLLILAPLSASAQSDVVSLPAGCTAYLTVQGESCQVDHHFTCQADAPGSKRRVSYDERGLIFVSEIDDETQWIDSFHVMTGHRERLEPAPAERASLTDLIANGVDEYDFQTLSDEVGTTRYVGRDTLTGERVIIDGILLEETTYDITALDQNGDEMWSAQGREFISRDWRMFLSGRGTVTTPSGVIDRANRPVEFIFPSEDGFLSANPKHGCGVAVS